MSLKKYVDPSGDLIESKWDTDCAEVEELCNRDLSFRYAWMSAGQKSTKDKLKSQAIREIDTNASGDRFV